jgi:broad-specificity NMP kinase
MRTIKVVKKGEKVEQKAVSVENKTTKQSAREMVSNVTTWVNEFQQRRREETIQAFEKFLSPQPQPNNA